VLAALQAAYAAAPYVAPVIEKDAQGNVLGRFDTHDSTVSAVERFPSSPNAIELVGCTPYSPEQRTWLCEAGVSFPEANSTVWSTWLLFNTSAGWQAAAQPEQHR